VTNYLACTFWLTHLAGPDHPSVSMQCFRFY